MTWELLPVLLLVLVFIRVIPRLLRRRRGLFSRSSSKPLPTLRVEVARTFEKKKRAALKAATTVLR
jgi:hypothetical protein